MTDLPATHAVTCQCIVGKKEKMEKVVSERPGDMVSAPP